ncbi:MAG: OmpA family protein, partial [Mariprofundaceae bacterium]
LSDLEITRIEVVGHTDSRRIHPSHRHEFANNQVLSEARARSVAEYLRRALKLRPEQMTVKGMGARKPIASNRTPEGMAMNRRTEVNVFASKVRHVLTTTVQSSHAEGGAKAHDDWAGKSAASPNAVSPASPAAPAPADVKAWLARQTSAAPALLFPTARDLPSIAATHVLVRHAPGQKASLTVNGTPASPFSFEGAKKNAAGTVAISHWRNVHLQDGENRLAIDIQDASGKRVKHIEQTVVFAGAPATAEWDRDHSDAVADGQRPPVIAVRFLDRTGQPAREGMQGEFSVDQPYRAADEPDDPLTAPQSTSSNRRARYVIGKDGIARIALKPTTQAGEVVLRFRLADGIREVRAWIKPATRDWIMVGFGEGTLGYNKLKGAIQPIRKQSEKDGYYRDGRLAFYAKGRVKGDFLLTMAYDTAKTKGKVGNSIKQVIDPNRYYTVYGDATTQGYDAASRAKLYLKLERDTFYAMFGDFNTGLTVTELTRYSRTMNGLKSEYHGPVLGYQAWASRTSQTTVRDEIRGDGTSGLYRLSRRNVLANSEQIVIETRDRFRSERIVDSQTLVRHVDYDIDYQAGTIFFKQPVPSKDANLNPVWIVVDYESDDQKDQFTNFGGRASIKPLAGVEIGASFVQEGQLGKDKRMGGLDLAWKAGAGTEVKAEIARSDTATVAKAKAWKAEVDHVGERLRAQAYARQVDGGFGLGQVNGSEDATRKLGGNAEVRLTDRLNLRTEAFRQQNLATNAKRDMGDAQLGWRGERYDLHAGARLARDTDGAGNRTTSKQATAGASARITERLSVRADREQNLGKGANSVDFPNRTMLGADYRLTDATTLSATQEWTQGARQNSSATRLGVKSRPWSGAQLSTSYEERLGEGGVRSFANVGMQQTWNPTDTLSIDIGFDRTKTLRHPGAAPLNLNTPLASGTSGLGGDNDFTAWSLGASWRPDADWVWDNRFEYRTSAAERKYNAFTGIQGRPLEWLTTQFRLQWNDARQALGRATGMNASLAAAWRPDHDGWIFLDRLEAILDRRRDPLGGNSTSWRYVNNLAANWQVSPAFQLGFRYGAKWAREEFATGSRRAWTDAPGLQATWDVTEDWDITAQASLLRTLQAGGQMRSSWGLGVGRRLFDNLWVGIGYNFTGFYDRDFAASEFTRRGVYLRFRFKFDQTDLDGFLNHGE